MPEFLRPYAVKKSAPLLGICASTHMTSSGVSADIRRLSDAGVSATVSDAPIMDEILPANKLIQTLRLGETLYYQVSNDLTNHEWLI